MPNPGCVNWVSIVAAQSERQHISNRHGRQSSGPFHRSCRVTAVTGNRDPDHMLRHQTIVKGMRKVAMPRKGE